MKDSDRREIEEPSTMLNIKDKLKCGFEIVASS
jgi:hypothetical protein